MGNVSTVIPILPEQDETLAFTERITKLDSLGKWMVSIRAERWIAANYKVHAVEMQALAITFTFLLYHKIQSSNLKRIVDWSGARRRWKYKTRNAMEGCIQKGLIKRVKVNSGFTLKITSQGFTVIRAYEMRCREIEKEMIKQANKNRKIIREKLKQAA